jgi:prepilin-type N-terminal cleavage/methylation domain-containing protein
MINLLLKRQPRAVTLLELLAVVMIVSILATVATGVYTGEIKRARISATKDLIHQLDVAIARYEVDCGSLPPSGSADASVPPEASSRQSGSGYLHLALVHSMSGDASKPASASWKGPYINLQADQVAHSDTSTSSSTTLNVGLMNILDPWSNKIIYVEHADYTQTGDVSGTKTFSGTAPDGANPDLPAPYPYGEAYYNPSTDQLLSYGPDGQTLSGYPGAAKDDVNNFGY